MCCCRYLQNNFISTLPTLAFNNLTLEFSLDLQGNQILTIDDRAFDNIAVDNL